MILETVKLQNNSGFRPASYEDLIDLSKRLTTNSLLEMALSMEAEGVHCIDEYIESLYDSCETYVVHDGAGVVHGALYLREMPTPGVVFIALVLSDEFKTVAYDFMKLGNKVLDALGNHYQVAVTNGFYRDDVAHQKFLHFFKFRLLDECQNRTLNNKVYTYVRSY